MAKSAARKKTQVRKPARNATSARRTTAIRKPAARATSAPNAAGRTARRTAKSIPPLRGATQSRELGSVRLEFGKAGSARVKRMIYPPGFRWSRHMKPVVGTDLCMHAHVGYLAQGEIHIEYWDGCVVEHKAPQIIAIDPGHDGWVVGKQPVIMIEFDFERDTLAKLGMPTGHSHP